jgi:hypothetical protein
VTAGPGRDETHVSEVTYILDSARDPNIQASGRLTGTVPAGKGLHLVKTGVAGTYDATADHNPAASTFFIQAQTTPRPTGCWSYQNRLRYPCIGGITSRFYFMLIPDTTAKNLTAKEPQYPGGMPPSWFLNDPDIDNLGHIDVPSQPDPSCP